MLMSEITDRRLTQYLSDVFGTAVRVLELDGSAGVWFEVRFAGLENPYGFSIQVSRWPNFWVADLVPDTFPGGLIDTMVKCRANPSDTIEKSVAAAESQLAEFKFLVSSAGESGFGKNVLSLNAKNRIGYDLSGVTGEKAEPEFESLLKMLEIALLPVLLCIPGALDGLSEGPAEVVGELEGAKTLQLCAKYERSRKTGQFAFRSTVTAVIAAVTCSRINLVK